MKQMTKYEAEQLLGLSGSYMLKDIQKARAEMSKLHHPDQGGDQELMKKINIASSELTKLFKDNRGGTVTCSVDESSFMSSIFNMPSASSAESNPTYNSNPAPSTDINNQFVGLDWNNLFRDFIANSDTAPQQTYQTPISTSQPSSQIPFTNTTNEDEEPEISTLSDIFNFCRDEYRKRNDK